MNQDATLMNVATKYKQKKYIMKIIHPPNHYDADGNFK